MSSTTQVCIPTADPALSPANVATAVLANALTVKAQNSAHKGAGTVYGIGGYTTTTQFIQIHDTLAAPTAGAVPKFVIPITANQPFSIDFGIYGLPMLNGIFITNSTTGPTLTAGAADTFMNVRYL